MMHKRDIDLMARWKFVGPASPVFVTAAIRRCRVVLFRLYKGPLQKGRVKPLAVERSEQDYDKPSPPYTSALHIVNHRQEAPSP